MVNFKELRIGNWILDGGRPTTVDSIMDYGNSHVINCSILDGCIDLYAEKPEPIPLTAELLENCGFKDKKSVHGDTFQQLDYGGIAFQSGDDGFCITLKHDFYLVDAKYLHQLQNLYYSITGKELEVNL